MAVTLGKLEPLLEAAAMTIYKHTARSNVQTQWEAWIEWEVLRRTAFGLWVRYYRASHLLLVESNVILASG